MAACDILIIGSGIAGLSLAIKLNQEFPERKICIVTKGDELESSTRHAQGGISVACDKENDSFKKHIDDTLNAGGGLCNTTVVEKVVRYSQNALFDLIQNGVELDKDDNGQFLLAKEGGHSTSRIVHCKDMTGFQIAVSLLAKVKTQPGITLLSNHMAVDLITAREIADSNAEGAHCFGALILNRENNNVEKFISRVTVLATGGIGQVYRASTNPKIATGDGIGIAHRAGASISNMEFIQFHPTAFYCKESGLQKFLITEAIRGYGASLQNCNGERFMFKYDLRGELACRDVVARAIENEIKVTGHPCVFIDCRHLPPEELIRDFPNVHAYCMEKGIDITMDLIPVSPAAHYLCGGIDVDLSGRTSINNLYAIGECAHTGLHGANRLASNSLLEAAAFAEFCFQDIRKNIGSNVSDPVAPDFEIQYTAEENQSVRINVLMEKVRNIMTKAAGITRTTKGLRYALRYLLLVEKRLDDCCPAAISTQRLELQNMLATARLIVIQSLNRTENRGTFYNLDLDIDYAIHSNKQGISLG